MKKPNGKNLQCDDSTVITSQKKAHFKNGISKEKGVKKQVSTVESFQ